jgi:uncharacterized protein YegJ (DUF2314 family)
MRQHYRLKQMPLKLPLKKSNHETTENFWMKTIETNATPFCGILRSISADAASISSWA